MRVTVVQKAVEAKKPSNFCPWFIEDPPAPKK